MLQLILTAYLSATSPTPGCDRTDPPKCEPRELDITLALLSKKMNETMKLYYSKDRQRYEVSELGKLIDSDTDMAILMTRNGWQIDDLPTEFNGDDQLQLTDDEVSALFQELGEVA